MPGPLTEEISPSASRHEARKLLAPGQAAGRSQGVCQHRGRYDCEVQHNVKSHTMAHRLKGIRARLRLARLRSGRADIGNLAVTT